jgi:ribonuclease P protein component
MSEAYVPTKYSQASQEARLPPSDVDSGRAGRDPGSTAQGSRPSVRLIWRVERRDTFLALRAARRSRSGPLTVSWVPGDPAQPARVAFAIGRKVGPAVERNLLRRRLRALVQETAAPLRPGAYLIGATPGAAGLSYHSLGQALSEALVKNARVVPGTQAARTPSPAASAAVSRDYST